MLLLLHKGALAVLEADFFLGKSGLLGNDGCRLDAQRLFFANRGVGGRVGCRGQVQLQAKGTDGNHVTRLQAAGSDRLAVDQSEAPHSQVAQHRTRSADGQCAMQGFNVLGLQTNLALNRAPDQGERRSQRLAPNGRTTVQHDDLA